MNILGILPAPPTAEQAWLACFVTAGRAGMPFLCSQQAIGATVGSVQQLKWPLRVFSTALCKASDAHSRSNMCSNHLAGDNAVGPPELLARASRQTDCHAVKLTYCLVPRISRTPEADCNRACQSVPISILAVLRLPRYAWLLRLSDFPPGSRSQASVLTDCRNRSSSSSFARFMLSVGPPFNITILLCGGRTDAYRAVAEELSPAHDSVDTPLRCNIRN